MLLFTDKHYSVVWRNHILFTHLPTDGLLCCFRRLATMHNTTMHICARESLCRHMFSFRHLGVKLLRHMIRLNFYEIAKMFSMFHSHQERMSSPVALHSHPWLVWPVFSIAHILMGVQVFSHCGFLLW